MPDPTRRGHADPWDAVLADLAASATEPPAPPTGSPSTRPTLVTRGHGFSARPETIRRVKERAIVRRRLYAVEFDSDQPFPAHWRWLIAAEEEDHGWVARGGAGGAGDAPQRSEPWINIAGWWGTARFYAGGEVLSHQPISRVRLTTRDGSTLEDDTGGNVVLFLTDHSIELPVTLELFGDSGQVLASQLALDLPR